ncbi:MAG: DEAD/DEAH box helicase [bacterium]|nr:DEAD/DEAH box helicase [bacterium]
MQATITLRDGMFRVSLPNGTAPIPQISEWVGWKRSPKGTYSAPLWASSALAPRSAPGIQVVWSLEASHARDELLARLNRARCDTVLPLKYKAPTEREPRLHQWAAIHAAREMGWNVLLNDDMGLGKTSEALWMAQDAHATRVLVICPASVKFNWKAEIEATLGESWSTFVVDGAPKKRAQTLADLAGSSAADLHAHGTVCVINYDLLRCLTPDQRTQLNVWISGIGMLICDESHYLKNRKSERTKLVQALGTFAKFRLLLTGTPIMNQADDLFSQVQICRPGTWTSYHDFAKRHLVITRVTFGAREVMKVTGTKNLDQLNAVLNTMQIQRKKEDVLDLPPKVYTYPELELDDITRRVYVAMKNHAKLEMKALAAAGFTSIFDPRAKSAVEAAMRCEQIAQGFVGGIPDPVMLNLSKNGLLKHAEKIPGRPNELIFPGSAKLMWLLEKVTDVINQGGQPFILSRFNAPISWLLQELSERKISASMLYGGVPAKERQDAIDWFQQGRAQVMLCQVKVAVGFNLTASQDVLFLGRDWSPAVNEQGTDRTHRMGQAGTVNVQIPIVRKTIETMIHQRLAAKGAEADQALKTVTVQELMEAL